MIVILDYGMGNLRSVERAVTHLGFQCSVQQNLSGVTKLIIPGVGAFGAAMERLHPLKGDIQKLAKEVPVMGICLGQQVMFESSTEMGSHEGLGLLAGQVTYLPKRPNLKVPHVGWNEVEFQPGARLGGGFPKHGQVYFVHSLVCQCGDPQDIAATSCHGITFAAAVERGHVWGTQFHPEKSGTLGLGLLRNFLAL